MLPRRECEICTACGRRSVDRANTIAKPIPQPRVRLSRRFITCATRPNHGLGKLDPANQVVDSRSDSASPLHCKLRDSGVFVLRTCHSWRTHLRLPVQLLQRIRSVGMLRCPPEFRHNTCGPWTMETAGAGNPRLETHPTLSSRVSSTMQHSCDERLVGVASACQRLISWQLQEDAQQIS